MDIIDQHIQEQHAVKYSKYIRPMVYGGLDGIITTFSIISAAIGGGLDFKTIIIMGISNLISDGISMGFGEYTSVNIERQYILWEKSKELYEIENNIDNEIYEMIVLLMEKGMTHNDAEKVIKIYTSNEKYKDIFLNYMMYMELNMLEPDNKRTIMKNGLVTFTSFVIFGSIPLTFFFLIVSFTDLLIMHTYIISCFIAVLTMFVLGILQAKISKQHMIKNGLFITFNGSLAISVAFIIGYLLQELLSI